MYYCRDRTNVTLTLARLKVYRYMRHHNMGHCWLLTINYEQLILYTHCHSMHD